MERSRIGLWGATAIGLGNIIGAGIFVMAGSAIDLAGPGALVAFLITAVLAMGVGMSSAELASALPNVEGGVYSFAKETMGDALGFLVGFMRAVSYVIGGAAVAQGFASYFLSLGFTNVPGIPVAILLVLGMGFIYSRGLKSTSSVEKVIVTINVIGILVFIVTALYLSHPSATNFSPLFPHGLTGLLSAASLAFFAYSGFNTIATLTPDVKDGERNVPRAILISLVVTTLLYMGVVFAMVYALPWQVYGTQGDPLTFALRRMQAPAYLDYLISMVAMLSTLTVTLSMIVAGTRTLEQMSRDDLAPKALGRVSVYTVTFFMVLSLFMGNVETLGLAANFGVVFSYLTTPVSVFIARRRGLHPKYRSPGYPLTQLMAVILSLIILASLGEESLVIGAVSLSIGVLLYGLHAQVNVVERGKMHRPHGRT